MPTLPNSLTTTAVPCAFGRAEKAAQQRGLAGAEKAGARTVDRNALRRARA